MKKTILFALLLCWISVSIANQLISDAPEGAQVYFISPSDGDVVSSPVTIKFGLKGMGVAPAGTQREHTGHHHLLINLDVESLNMQQPLPATEQVVHFGGGQTEAQIELPAGHHNLQLLLGNYAHVPHDKPVLSEKIHITVE